MLKQFAVEIPTLPVDQCHSHLTRHLEECCDGLSCRRAAEKGCQAFGTHDISGNVLSTHLHLHQLLILKKSINGIRPRSRSIHHGNIWSSCRHSGTNRSTRHVCSSSPSDLMNTRLVFSWSRNPFRSILMFCVSSHILQHHAHMKKNDDDTRQRIRREHKTVKTTTRETTRDRRGEERSREERSQEEVKKREEKERREVMKIMSLRHKDAVASGKVLSTQNSKTLRIPFLKNGANFWNALFGGGFFQKRPFQV